MIHRLTVDLTRCRGHGICMLLLADRVDLDKWGFPVVDGTELASKESLRRARRAAFACPTGALKVEGADANERTAGAP
ncbi:MAG: ferredoxin [Acidimicrobiales bacterium]